MDTNFLVLLISGRTEQVKASRYEIETEMTTNRLVYKFYTQADTTARCFFACEDIIGIIPSDMREFACMQ